MKKVAILCAGLDDVMRGYETHCRTLFTALNDEHDKDANYVLFKRSGSSKPNEHVLRTPSRDSKLVYFLARYRGDRLYWEYLFFALKFILTCRMKNLRFNTISCIEPMAAKTIRIFRNLLPGKPTLVYTHGVWMSPHEYINNADIIHEVSIENYQAMMQYVKEHQLKKEVRLLPHFLKDDLRSQLSKEAAKQRFQIPFQRVILSVGDVNRVHKRMHYLIEEVAKLDDSWSLVICGGTNNSEAEQVLQLAHAKLGNRFMHFYLTREEMLHMYAAADVFVLCSTTEGFGLVNIEAMRAGLPLILHRTDLFKWILQNDAWCIDMNAEDALWQFIKAHQTSELLHEVGQKNRQRFQEQFLWKSVKQQYLDMLEG
jgi:glycosyltransferase involved in cell wall biosynthesis